MPVEFIIVESGNHGMLNNGSIFQAVLQRMERFLSPVFKEDGYEAPIRHTKVPHRRVPGLKHSQSIHRAVEYRTVMARGAGR